LNSRNVDVGHGKCLARRFLGGRAAGYASGCLIDAAFLGEVLLRPPHALIERGKCVRDDKLDALVAELQAIELWDRAREKLKPASEGEIEARRLRRLEIVREIEAILERQIEALR
jgi:hypothetical protein